MLPRAACSSCLEPRGRRAGTAGAAAAAVGEEIEEIEEIEEEEEEEEEEEGEVASGTVAETAMRWCGGAWERDYLVALVDILIITGPLVR